MKTILVVSHQKDIVTPIQTELASEFKIQKIEDYSAALSILHKIRFDFVLIDIRDLREASGGNGFKTALQAYWQIYPTLEIIILCTQETIRDAVMAVKAGASNYLTYPLNPHEVKYVLETIHESNIALSELEYLRDKFWQSDSLDLVQTKSPQMKAVFEKIRSVAPTKSTVLLSGETGTGKGVMAKLIHRHSNRRDAQFISVHCGAIPDTLLESELFGHEKGAFTGAIKRKLGKFEIANGGTIFLDEVGTITPSAQIKLLQVLQDSTFQRVGGEQTITVNVRVIAATNTDLQKMCEQGQFRKDLYYRLNVFPIDIPLLRDRLEDIPHLADGFLMNMNRLNTKPIADIDPRVIEAFTHYSWPGNIRELENVIERAYILETSSRLQPTSFPVEFFAGTPLHQSISLDESMTLAQARQKGIEEIERRYLKDLLSRTGGKIKTASEIAGLSTRQLHKLMSRYNIQKEEFKNRPHL